jgi:hypothetical protein
LALTITIGQFIARSSVASFCVIIAATDMTQNTAANSSDEEDDLTNLHSIEQKLLAHDPTFTPEHTHASITTQRSALISAFRPQYEEGDVQGQLPPWVAVRTIVFS